MSACEAYELCMINSSMIVLKSHPFGEDGRYAFYRQPEWWPRNAGRIVPDDVGDWEHDYILKSELR